MKPSYLHLHKREKEYDSHWKDCLPKSFNTFHTPFATMSDVDATREAEEGGFGSASMISSYAHTHTVSSPAVLSTAP